MQRRTPRHSKVTRLVAPAKPSTRRVAIVTYPDAQSLDVTGPFEVFAMTNQYVQESERQAVAPYAIEILAARPGPVAMSSGMRICADRAYASVRSGIDTLVISGGNVYAAAGDRQLRAWLQAMARKVRRLASVCSGAFILAEAGLLDGRRATTHWLGVALLQRRYPRITVEADAIFVRDGNVYTSAGVTAGIDLALALLEEDLGHPTALAVARRLVVFLKRPGGQSQFSSHLAAQAVPQGLLRDLPEWIVDHVDGDLSVEALAARAAMSPRNFARVFLRASGVTPAKFVERARIDAARRLLENDGLSLEDVAGRCGFASGEHMRRTFLRHLRVVPMDYRRRFRAAS
jgi:transcriptional regulator GlxA family with amidase domain